MAFFKYKMKISISTFGCKLNQAESDELKKTLTKLGLFIVPAQTNEEIAVIRGCAVTCGASRSTREMIRRLKKNGAYIIATGCLENNNLPEIDLIAKNNEEAVKEIIALNKESAHETEKNLHATTDRTRAFIKIQNGCNFNCAYCIIPSFRGKARSVPSEKILEKILEVEKDGYQEIVLTGVNICQYRQDKMDLTGLLKYILKNTSIPRLRLGSLDPRLITPDLIKLYNSDEPRLMPHWHLSLQSGSDEILSKMNRFYTTKKYLLILQKLKKHYPFFSFTTDIIVGFPGETEKDFQATCSFVKQAGFSKVHIFPYSVRPGTAAEKFTNQVQAKIKTERAKFLNRICTEAAADYNKKIIGLIRPILMESKRYGFYTGYTPEYILIKYKSQRSLKNKIINLKLETESFSK